MIVRPFTSKDFGTLSILASAERPDRPVTSEQLQHAEEHRAPHLKFGGFLAEVHSQGIGFAWYTQYADYYQADKVVLRGFVLEAHRRRGVGSALFKALDTHLATLGITTMQIEVGKSDSETREFLRRRGFDVTWQRTDYALDITQASLEELLPLSKQLEAQGIIVVTYPQLSADRKRDEKLRALNWLLEQDVPYGEPPVELTLQAFTQERLAPKAVLKDAFFVAKHNASYIGMSSLWRNGEQLDTEFTGVLPEYRGRAIARLMKLRGISYAKQHGYREIQTTNDEHNHGMRAVNERLGFKPQRTVLRLEREVNQ